MVTRALIWSFPNPGPVKGPPRLLSFLSLSLEGVVAGGLEDGLSSAGQPQASGEGLMAFATGPSPSSCGCPVL